MIQAIRPLDVRLKTNVYNELELRMIVEKLSSIEDQLEPQWRLVINNLFIAQADILVNGAPN